MAQQVMNHLGAYLSILLMVLAIAALAVFAIRKSDNKTPVRKATKCNHVLGYQRGFEHQGKCFTLEFPEDKEYAYCGDCMVANVITCPLCRMFILPGYPVELIRAKSYGAPEGATLFNGMPDFFLACTQCEKKPWEPIAAKASWEIGPNEIGYAEVHLQPVSAHA